MSEELGCVGILAFGALPEGTVDFIADLIPTHLGMQVKILPPLGTPSYALDPSRLQYNVARIIEHMEAMRFPGCRKVLGILTVDLFLPVFTHVFGEAREGGGCAVVSLYRLKKDEGGFEAPVGSVAERAAKVALHELAHLFDIPHCMDHDCLMHFSMNLQALDEMPMEFCRYCKSYLKEGLRR